MAFTNSDDFEDDFRKVGKDATAGLEPEGTSNDALEHASSENVSVAGKAEEADDLEDDEDEDDLEDEEDDDDLEDDDADLDDDDDDDDEEDDEEEDESVADGNDEDGDDDDEEDDDDLEDDDTDAVKARLGDAEKTARKR